MKKYLSIVICLIVFFLTISYLHYEKGVYFDYSLNNEVSTNFFVDNKEIYIKQNNLSKKFEIRGVDMGTGLPGEWSTDFAGDKKTYLEWFKLIQEMGANTIRIYTINPTDFYDALYEFNLNNDNPLYLIQGVWVDENVLNSHLEGYDTEFIDDFTIDCKRAVDVIHGDRTIGESESKNLAKGDFRTDISQYVIGYIIGVEWESTVIAYTNDVNEDEPKAQSYNGKYLYTTENVSPFETMLCRVGDAMIEYETDKYNEQRLLAFSNWPDTDPFEYPDDIKKNMKKYASIDVEHIKQTENFVSGQFASYHVYPYYPNYIKYLDDWSIYGIDEQKDYFIDGEIHSYQAYIEALVNHHSMPVIISEFGVPSSRAVESLDVRQGRDQGGLSEDEQAEKVVELYHEIMNAGCAGCCVFSWQDEWFKRSWNTLYSSDTKRNALWSDYQTVEQSFGILGFDPAYEDNFYNDGDVSEWTDNDLISSNNGIDLYMQNDEKYVYFRIHNDNMDFDNDTYYIPIDVNPKVGSTTCDGVDLIFNKNADFLIKIHGYDDSDIKVQKRYECLASTLAKEIYGYDTYLVENIPDIHTSTFVDIRLGLHEPTSLIYGKESHATNSSYITGTLIYGNGNRNSSDYLSNSDYYTNGTDIELRIPWALLNFSDPSLGEIHDDYYENYGVSYMNISNIYAGVAISTSENSNVNLDKYQLDKWNENISYTPYLKALYYALQDEWVNNDIYEIQVSESIQKEVKVSLYTDVPVLMYHDFVLDGEISEKELDEYTIYASEFESDLIYLKENGYTTLNTNDLSKIIDGEMEMPSKPIILSIDDGDYGVYDVAYPLLKEYGMKAVLSVIGSFINQESINADKELYTNTTRSYGFLTWSELNKMVKSNVIEAISHTFGLHVYENQEELFQTNDWGNVITSDSFEMYDTLNRQGVKYNKSLAYPYSLRTKESDIKFFEMGFRILYCGDIYSINNNTDYSFTSKYVSYDDVYLVPRLARFHGHDIKYYIDKIKTNIRNGK